MYLKLGLLLLILPLVILMGAWGLEYIEVSHCIHAGGQYDYLTQECLQDQRAIFIPFAERYPLLVNGSFWLACAGLLLCLIGLYQSRM